MISCIVYYLILLLNLFLWFVTDEKDRSEAWLGIVFLAIAIGILQELLFMLRRSTRAEYRRRRIEKMTSEWRPWL